MLEINIIISWEQNNLQKKKKLTYQTECCKVRRNKIHKTAASVELTLKKPCTGHLCANQPVADDWKRARKLETMNMEWQNEVQEACTTNGNVDIVTECSKLQSALLLTAVSWSRGHCMNINWGQIVFFQNFPNLQNSSNTCAFACD